MSSRHLQDMSSRRLQDQQMFTGKFEKVEIRTTNCFLLREPAFVESPSGKI